MTNGKRYVIMKLQEIAAITRCPTQRVLLDMLQQHKHTIHDTIPSEVWNGIQARIHYQPTAADGGYENHIVHIIHQ